MNGKKGLSKGSDGFQEGGFRPYQQARIIPRTEARERTLKERI